MSPCKGPFLGVESFLNKHSDKHPNLGSSIVATELSRIGGDTCPKCKKAGTLSQFGFTPSKRTLWTDACRAIHERIERLKKRGVTVITGYDATEIHKHDKIFRKIHWICPHDRRGSYSDPGYEEKGLPKLIHDFFASASQRQETGDKIYVVLALPKASGGDFHQGVIYGIAKAVEDAGYSLFKKRHFGSDRYPGYSHTITGEKESAPKGSALENKVQGEFVFIKGPSGKPSYTKNGRFEVKKACSDDYRVVKGKYYEIDTDYDSSDCEMGSSIDSTMPNLERLRQVLEGVFNEIVITRIISLL